MKHLQKLAYRVVQFELKHVLVIGSLFGAISSMVFERWYLFPVSLLVVFISEIYYAHKSFKKTGKY